MTIIYILVGCVIMYIIVQSILKTRRHRSDVDYNHVTKTGETFGERASYHQRGELSPGEHALAAAIRESLNREKDTE